MRSIVLGALGAACLAVVALGTAPVAAAAPAKAAPQGSGWEPAPSDPWDVPAGERCAFPIHGEPIVDEVVRRELPSPGEGVTRSFYKGDLVVRVTNKETGAYYDADSSGVALIDEYADGAQRWHILGPVLLGVGEGNLPRGMWLVNGAYKLQWSADRVKTVTGAVLSKTDVCAQID
ncbi:hypothetical protein [Streptomyces griseus]|uniref:hypothetical protein n=1 Tax=Streptomyces griseus TaxID=1911 RepID=UPI0033C4FCF3